MIDLKDVIIKLSCRVLLTCSHVAKQKCRSFRIQANIIGNHVWWQTKIFSQFLCSLAQYFLSAILVNKPFRLENRDRLLFDVQWSDILQLQLLQDILLLSQHGFFLQHQHVKHMFCFYRYELCAIQKEKVRRMETKNGKPKDVITVEVEMQESKCSRESQTLSVDSESQDS